MKTLLYQIPTEVQIRKQLKNIIFGHNVFCPNCRSRQVFKTENRYRCKRCKLPFTLISGTWLKGMKLPLRVFWSLLWCWTQKIPVLQSQKLCGLSEECIRRWFGTFRAQLPSLCPNLNGLIQMDEAYFKSLSLVMAKEVGSRKIAHVFVRGNSVTRPDVAEFIFQHVKPESQLNTDGAAIYRGIENWWPVRHERDIHKKFEFGKTSEIEGMFGCLRTFIRRMYHHVTPEYLPEIVAEFTARFTYPEMFYSPESYLQKTMRVVPFD